VFGAASFCILKSTPASFKLAPPVLLTIPADLIAQLSISLYRREWRSGQRAGLKRRFQVNFGIFSSQLVLSQS
jgi:hypothetical protein